MTTFHQCSLEKNISHRPTAEMMYNGPEEGRCMDMVFSVSDVKRKLSKLRDDKAAGSDDLAPRLLREVQDHISYPLFLLFRRSLDEGVVPGDWRSANVSPVYKSGSRIKAMNYRPVSLTSVICKVFESLMRDTIVSFLENKELLLDSQHGFRKGRSCLTNLATSISGHGHRSAGRRRMY